MAQGSEDIQSWTEARQQDLVRMLTPLCERLVKTDDSVEIAFIRIKTEVAGKMARTVRSVLLMSRPTRALASRALRDVPPDAPEPPPKDEAPMYDGIPDDPAELQAALVAKIGGIADLIERKRREGPGDRGGDPILEHRRAAVAAQRLPD